MRVKIFTVIVNYNHDKQLIKCVQSVKNNINRSEILIFSNSKLNNVTREDLTLFDSCHVFESDTNLGFAGANNQLFRQSSAPYILVLNPDAFITPNFINELLAPMEVDSSIGAVCGKLIRCTSEGEPTNIIDSTGIVIKKNRRAIDRGQGEVDNGQYDTPGYVFGCSGAAVLYRREMLEDIKYQDEYFDNDFFAYKEDIDLAWRAQWKGWKAYYSPKAVAYHARGWKKNNREKIPRFVQVHSYKNRYLMLLKNETLWTFLKGIPYILALEILALVYVFFRRPYLLRSWFGIISLLPTTVKKRQAIQSSRKVSDREMLKWFE